MREILGNFLWVSELGRWRSQERGRYFPKLWEKEVSNWGNLRWFWSWVFFVFQIWEVLGFCVFFIFWNLLRWHEDRVAANMETWRGNLGIENGINTKRIKTIIFFLLIVEHDIHDFWDLKTILFTNNQPKTQVFLLTNSWKSYQ